MGEKKKNPNFPDKEDLEGGAQTSIVSLIITGQYTFRYDKKGLKSSRSGGRLTEWYAFEIIAPNGKVIGEYHIHPGRRKGEYWSGNLRLWTSIPSAFDTQEGRDHGIVVIGRATDWQWLCDYLNK